MVMAILVVVQTLQWDDRRVVVVEVVAAITAVSHGVAITLKATSTWKKTASVRRLVGTE
jgi:hypothetical protein